MGGEPWRFTPEQIGKLTDYQIWEVYVRPAVERQRAAERRGRPRRKRDPFGGIPNRDEFITMGLKSIPGSTREHWEREFDAWAVTEDGQRHLAKRAEIEARQAAKALTDTEDFG